MSKKEVFVFQGGGQYIYWMLGMVEYIKRWKDMKDIVMIGASSGALCAALVASGSSSDDVLRATQKVYDKHRPTERWFGVFGIWSTMLEEWLDELLPMNAHEICTDKVHVIISRFIGPWMSVSSFESRRDLIECLLTSSHVPLYMNYMPFRKFRGHWCYDGDFSIKKQDDYELFGKFGYKYHHINYYEDENRKGNPLKTYQLNIFQNMVRRGYEHAQKKYEK